MALKTYNGVTYDDSIDYSAAIEQAKKSGQDTTALEASRNAKVQDKYKGNEPNMYGSNQKYSTVKDDTSDSGRQTISNAVDTASRLSGYDYSKPSNVSTDYKDYNTTYGTKGGANMKRNPALANMSVKQGNYTVTYDENGYAVSAKQDGGASATGYATTTHANDTVYHQLAYQAAAKGEWETAARYLNLMSETYQRDGSNDGYNTGVNLAAENMYLSELQNQFGYNAKNYYDGLYDKAYGAGSAAAWDASGGAIKTYQQLVDAVGADMAQQIIGTGNTASGQMSVPGYGGGAIGGFGTAGGSYGVTGGGYDYTPNGDAYQYIQDMYAANSASQLAALKAAYEQNVMDYNAQDDLISKQAQQLRNQAASQNDLQRMYMNEMGIMQGLNTGATGQMALAQSAALQGSFADIGTQEQQALADSALERSKLKVQYSAAVDQAIAQNNYELANALYQEYVRQDNLAQQAAAAAQEQANWQAKFDYQKQQDAWTNAAAQAELLAGFGDFSGYKALGYSDAQIDMMQNAWNAKYGTPAVGTTGTPGAAPKPQYDNSGLTPEQVKVLQNYYGVTADGAWGKNSTSAADGMTASQAWEAYLAGPLKSIEQSVGMNRTSNGQATAIQKALTSGRITEAQAEDMLKKFGIM